MNRRQTLAIHFPRAIRALAAALFALVLACALGATGAGAVSNPPATASVIGGHDANLTELPSLAYFEAASGISGYACTGTVVAPRIILTAGHCVEDIESSSITQPETVAVATGVANLRQIRHFQVSRVERVLAYPHFAPTKIHGDAGLLVLDHPVKAPPIALADATEDAELYGAGTELTLAGWGIDRRGTQHAAIQLQAGVATVEDPARCRRIARRYYPFLEPSSQLCVRDNPKHHVTPCNGDSGGPAIALRADGSPVEVGVTSLGSNDCNPAAPAVYTRVDKIRPWVESWIAAIEEDGPEPKVRIPRAHTPFLPSTAAQALTAFKLEEDFGSRFRNALRQRIQCRGQARDRQRCEVFWIHSGTYFYGTAVAFFAIRENVVVPGVNYAVHEVNELCYLSSEHPATCRVRTERG